MQVRPPAVAGQFYPADPSTLEQGVLALLEQAGPALAAAPPKCLIAPHAGYVYSGPVAASAYAQLQPVAGRVERVVLLGPAHRVRLRGLALPSVDAFETPLGSVPIDARGVALLADLPQVVVSDLAHQDEHSLEVHLPFLQATLGAFRLVPLVVGDASTEEVAQVLERLWGGPETLVVVSSDLSHYHDYATARRLDAATCRAIEALRGDQLGENSACGRVPVRGLLEVARRHGLAVRTLDLRSSGDTAGPRDRVVGYGAFTLAPRERAVSRDAGEAPPERLLALAAESIAHGLRTGAPLAVDLVAESAELSAPGAAFVTLRTPAGNLRGCVGSLEAHQPLAADVVHNAFRAAFHDPRFAPLRAEELGDLAIEVSILSAPEPIAAASEAELLAALVPHEDGLILEDGPLRATFLPDVWESLPTPREFVAALRRKVGLPPGHWSPATRAFRYRTRRLP